MAAYLHEGIAVLGDPTRREIFERLGEQPMAVGELAAKLPVTRPAVSQHLRVLERCGLVGARREGARRIYSLDPVGVAALRDSLDRFWEKSLAAFARAAELERREER